MVFIFQFVINIFFLSQYHFFMRGSKWPMNNIYLLFATTVRHELLIYRCIKLLMEMFHYLSVVFECNKCLCTGYLAGFMNLCKSSLFCVTPFCISDRACYRGITITLINGVNLFYRIQEKLQPYRFSSLWIMELLLYLMLMLFTI